MGSGEVKQKLDRTTIALRVAREFKDGDVVNLGAGIPTLCSNFLPEGRKVWLHSENGVLGYGPLAGPDERDPNLINAGTQFITTTPGISFFSSADAFNMIRGGHVDITVLGAFQVSEKGDLANWILPGRGSGNIGGAMELVTGAKKLIVAMEHTTRDGEPKLVEKCEYLPDRCGMRKPGGNRPRGGGSHGGRILVAGNGSGLAVPRRCSR